VPIDQVVESSASAIHLGCTKDELAGMEAFIETQYVQGSWQPAWHEYAMSSPGMTMGDSAVEVERIPEGGLALHRGTHVEATDGRVGKVGELVVDHETLEVTHFVLQEGHLWGKKVVTLPLSVVDKVEEDAVHLKLDRTAVEQLPAIPLKRFHWHPEPVLELVVKVFDDPGQAEEQLEFVQDLHRRRTIRIQDAAVLVRDADGTPRIMDTRDLEPKKGGLLGAVTGGLVGLVGGPAGMVAGALAGAGAGAVAGRWLDLGFSDKFLNNLEEHLQPGKSALVVLVKHDFAVTLSESLARSEGVIVQQELTDKLVQELLSESAAA
jgi:uncharacterized membrane protein